MHTAKFVLSQVPKTARSSLSQRQHKRLKRSKQHLHLRLHLLQMLPLLQ